MPAKGDQQMQLRSCFGFSLIASTIIMAGCTGIGPPARHPPDCGAAALQNKIGLPVTGNSAEDVRVGGAPVRSKGDVRIVSPGQAVIHNYSDARLNLETDGRGNLKRAACG
ncbi:MAG: hypothetical protein E5Y29_04680 [Mesorhizobium sp.]|nr:MAG: hypothetical protein E5Y29_04680 [Mesorhizobium sp.]